MRNVIIFLSILCFISACKDENGQQFTRILDNTTDKEIEVMVYSSGALTEEFVIKPQSSDTTIAVCDYSRGTLRNCPLVWFLENDSVKLVFNKVEELKYCKSESICPRVNGKNIMRFSVFPISGEFNGGFKEVSENVFVFTIEESDYELAEPIE